MKSSSSNFDTILEALVQQKQVLAELEAENESLRRSIRSFHQQGGTIYAECGGLMYLCEAIRTLDGASWKMAGLLPGVAVMSPRRFPRSGGSARSSRVLAPPRR